jgi:inorganic triphosphatase YgiF
LVDVTASTEPLPREVEVALAVRAASPERVLHRIAGLEAIDGLALVPRPTQRLRDRYVDTNSGDLGARWYALRIREVDGAARITLKGESKRLASGSDRLELELPWSREAAARVLAELHRRGLPVGADVGEGEPVAALAAAGLRQIQERETLREVRSVRDGAGSELAELDLDAVTYRFPRGDARLYEVELEARAPGVDLDPIVAALRRASPELTEWRHGKLVTGTALERALAAGAIQLGPDGSIPPASLDALAAALTEEP